MKIRLGLFIAILALVRNGSAESTISPADALTEADAMVSSLIEFFSIEMKKSKIKLHFRCITLYGTSESVNFGLITFLNIC